MFLRDIFESSFPGKTQLVWSKKGSTVLKKAETAAQNEIKVYRKLKIGKPE